VPPSEGSTLPTYNGREKGFLTLGVTPSSWLAIRCRPAVPGPR
jgi:hypothetical protein